MRLRPNPPRMVTVVLALGLLGIGLLAYFVPGDEVVQLLRQFDLPSDMRDLALAFVDHDLFAYAALAAAPLLLIAGSLLRDL